MFILCLDFSSFNIIHRISKDLGKTKARWIGRAEEILWGVCSQSTQQWIQIYRDQFSTNPQCSEYRNLRGKQSIIDTI